MSDMRTTPLTDRDQRDILELSETQQRHALNYVWGAASVRSPDLIDQALAFAEGRLDELLAQTREAR